jgi:ribosomal protein RSM22 (predicted rRNA methylase)
MTAINIKISAKDISNYLKISLPTAQRYYTDIKKEYELKIVTEQHFKNYFKL